MQYGAQTDVMVMDCSKAFGNVSHSKPHHYNQGKINSWIKALLTDISQQVCQTVNISMLQPDNVTGVPWKRCPL